MAAQGDQEPERCVLQHQVFSSFGEVIFRRAEADGTPVMVMQLGDREASVPLRSLQREFSIGDDTPDGRMLGLIAESLDFVSCLRNGDALPSEVLSGVASWEPGPQHIAIAQGRLKGHLVAWVAPDLADKTLHDVAAGNAQAARRLEEDAELRAKVQTALSRAAVEMQLPGPTAVMSKLEELAGELAYIEALRESLLSRVQSLVAKVAEVQPNGRSDTGRNGTLTQVQRLSRIALTEIGQRFAEVDAQTTEVMAALRNFESQQVFIRSNRDTLYRSLRAWDPLLTAWGKVPGWTREEDAAFWALMPRTYQFLAARYMPVQEWHSNLSQRQRGKAKMDRVMAW